MRGRVVILKINGREMTLKDACNEYDIGIQNLIPSSVKNSPYVSREEKLISMIYKKYNRHISVGGIFYLDSLHLALELGLDRASTAKYILNEDRVSYSPSEFSRFKIDCPLTLQDHFNPDNPNHIRYYKRGEALARIYGFKCSQSFKNAIANNSINSTRRYFTEKDCIYAITHTPKSREGSRMKRKENTILGITGLGSKEFKESFAKECGEQTLVNYRMGNGMSVEEAMTFAPYLPEDCNIKIYRYSFMRNLCGYTVTRFAYKDDRGNAYYECKNRASGEIKILSKELVTKMFYLQKEINKEG
jgi:hypothetical protein